MNTRKNGVWVWTKKAENTAKKLNLDERKEGEPAYFGYSMLGNTAPEKWVKLGYVK